MPERGFSIFLIFLIFFRHFLVGASMNEIRDTNFFLFLGLSHPVLAKNNARTSFFYFLNFFAIFFRNFLARVEYELNSGLKFFPLFLGLSHSELAQNNARIKFFHFLNLFAIFFGIFLFGSSMNGIRD